VEQESTATVLAALREVVEQRVFSAPCIAIAAPFLADAEGRKRS